MNVRRRTAALALLLVAAGAAWLALGRAGPAPATTEAAGGPPPADRRGAPAWAAPAIAQVAVAPGPAADGEGALEGSVLDALSGAPIAGAELTFSLGNAAGAARSDADGRFRFRPPSAGTWRLAVATAVGYFPFAPEWGHSPISFDAVPGRVVGGVTLRLTAAEPMEGRVVGPEGRPVAGAEVRLLGAHLEAALVPIPDRFASGPDGRFTFAAPPGTALEARAEGLLPGRADVDFMARARGSVTIRLQELAHALPGGAPIAGKVVGRDAAPLAGALVTARRELGFGVADATAAAVLSAADGSFTLEDLGPGRWRVTARLAGRVPATAARVDPGTRDLVLRLADGGRLRGCVSDASTGQPVVALSVHLFEPRSTFRTISRGSRSSIDPSGCWLLDDVAPGLVRLVVSAPGYAPSAPRDVDVPEPGRGEAVADVRLSPGARLAGLVVSEGSGAPLAGARIALEGQLESATSALPALAEAATDAAGRFTLTGLPRRASIFVAAAGHHARIVSGIEAPPGASVGPVTVSLRPATAGEEPRVDLAGIGAFLAPHGDSDGFPIASLIADGGAARAGLVLGDVVLGVDGQRAIDLGWAETIQAIRGPEGTVVTLTVRRGGRTETVRVTRTLVRG